MGVVAGWEGAPVTGACVDPEFAAEGAARIIAVTAKIEASKRSCRNGGVPQVDGGQSAIGGRGGPASAPSLPVAAARPPHHRSCVTFILNEFMPVRGRGTSSAVY